MADFIYLEADASDDSNDEEAEMIIGDDNLIDDSIQENDELSFYRFYNQEIEIESIRNKMRRRAQNNIEHLDANNYLDPSEIDDIGNESLDESDDFERSKAQFLRSLKSPVENQTRENSFYFTLLHAIRFLKNKKSDQSDEIEIERKIGSDLYLKIFEKKINAF